MPNVESEAYEKTLARCKRAPSIVGDLVQARDAWRRYRRYSELAESARASFHKYTAGTATAMRHFGRYAAYSDVAEEWAKVLGSFLEDSAQVMIDDERYHWKKR